MQIQSLFPTLEQINSAPTGKIELLTTASLPGPRTPGELKAINNYLKSPAEIEAEFSLLACDQRLASPFKNPPVRSRESWLLIVNDPSANFPEFMEENY